MLTAEPLEGDGEVMTDETLLGVKVSTSEVKVMMGSEEDEEVVVEEEEEEEGKGRRGGVEGG